MRLILLFFVGTILTLWAGDAEDLTQTMQEKVLFITDVLADKALPKEQKKSKIEEAINPLFDYTLMARLSLGKKEWKELEVAKRKEYAGLFERRIKDSYLNKLDLYTDEEVVVESAVQTKLTRIEVPTMILTKTDKIEMLYKFYHSKKGTWLIYDVKIAGVSIVQTYRAQFIEILKSKTVFELIDQLKSSESL